MSGSPMNEYGLTERQEGFVTNYVRNGGNGTKAAVEAGYGKTCARVRASELLKMPKIQKRIETRCRDFMTECVPACLKVLSELAVRAKSESVKYNSASTILDRTGYKAPVLLEVSDNRPIEEIDKELMTLLGYGPSLARLEDDQDSPDAPTEVH